MRENIPEERLKGVRLPVSRDLGVTYKMWPPIPTLTGKMFCSCVVTTLEI
jgi:hypothetical protein